MAIVGVWATPRRLVAVFVDDHGKASPPILIERTDDARWGLLVRLEAEYGLDWELAISHDLLTGDALAGLAARRGIVIWVAPRSLVEAIRHAAGIVTGPTRRLAAMIARLPLCAGLRPHLRRVAPETDRRQLSLW